MLELGAVEEKTLAYWKDNGIMDKVRTRNIAGKVFYFLDGPPYVTGDLHPGHIWTKTLKDIFVRYKRARGFDVVDRAGYDVHGLPIENKVEKHLGISSKKDIEGKIGIDAFVKECRGFVERYMGRIDADYERYGISLDFKNPYLPYTKEYIEAAWMMFKKASDNGYLYKGKRTLIYCPHCETPLSQGSMEVEYSDVDDPSLFLAFEIDGKRSRSGIKLDCKAYLAVWTTTPWTIPANVSIAALEHVLEPSAYLLYVLEYEVRRQEPSELFRIHACSECHAGVPPYVKHILDALQLLSAAALHPYFVYVWPVKVLKR